MAAEVREIKFRAWDKVSKTMHNWGFGEGVFISPTTTTMLSPMQMPHMQFTGLKDKNGVEIYEGDLFSAWDNRSYYAVEWNEQSAGFHLVWVKGDIGDSKSHHYFEMFMAEYQFEPVGNIYENGDLINDN